MIKGICRQIIEVSHVENPYFERALFVVRPEFCESAEDELRESAQVLLARTQSFSALRRRRILRRIGTALSLLGAAGLGAAVALLIR